MAENIAKLLLSIDVIKKTIERKKESLRKSEQKKAVKARILDDICRPVCLKAVKDFNEKIGWPKIHADNMIISLNATAREISLSVEMRYASGGEPDESFFDEDVKFQSVMSPILDKALREAGIPLTFGKFILPASYFGK